MPQISIVIPVYNVELYLPECLDSICRQSFRDIEIILVDDGSTDHSGILCDDYAAKDARITVIHQKNKGLSAARNSGIEIAKGDFLSFIDSDDCVERTFLETLYQAAVENKAEIVAVGHRGIAQDAKKEYKKNSAQNGNIKVYTREQALVEHLLTTSVDVVAWNKLYARNIWETLRYPVGYLFEDMLTTYKAIQKANLIAFVPNKLYCYRQRKGSIGNTEFSGKWYGLSDAIDQAYGAAKRENPDNSDLECFYCLWKMAFVNKAIGHTKNDKTANEKVKQVQIVLQSRKFSIHTCKRISHIRKWELQLAMFSLPMYRLIYKQYQKLFKG